VFHGKPVIGITGGIGSGKSTVAGMFGEIGCLVISADEQVHRAYQDPAVIAQLRKWWGNEVLAGDGQLNRKKVADIVFSDAKERQKLEGLLHPKVTQQRQERMAEAGDDPQVTAIVWDTPLLFETGLRGGCDAIVFVEAPLVQRLFRILAKRFPDQT
jgi:dephospho-CoA kinase